MKKLFLSILIVLIWCSVASGADYYVNPACSSGCDGTSIAKGWATFADVNANEGLLDNANTTLWIAGGTYNETLDIAHATTSYTLTIRPMSAHPTDSAGYDGMVIISPTSGACITISGNKVTVNGKTSDSCTATTKYGDGCRNIRFNIASGGYGGRNSSGTQQGQKWLYIEQIGLNSEYGLDATGCTADCEIAYCYSHDAVSPVTGVDIYSNGSGGSYGIVKVHHNKVVASTEDLCMAGSGVDVYDNYFDSRGAIHAYDVTQYASTAGISYLRWYNNYVIQSNQMVFLENNTIGVTPTENVLIYNNVFTVPVRCESPCPTHLGNTIKLENEEASKSGYISSVNNLVIANNTFVRVYYGVEMQGTYVPPNYVVPYSNMKIVNNIFYDLYTTEIAVPVSPVEVKWTPDTNVVFDYNLIYRRDGGINLNWQTDSEGVFRNYTSFGATWVAEHPTMTNNQNGNPNFVNSGADTYSESSDFRPSATSTLLINMGMDLTSVLATFGITDTSDHAGVTRSGAWDIGAYEYAGSTPPSATGCTMSGAQFR